MMGTRKAIATTIVIAAFAIATSAHAFMMSLGGPSQMMGPGGAHSNVGADALYALDHFGREIKIAETDVPGPDGVVMQDLGVPSVGDDGNVWFAAAIFEGRQLRWRIFSADPNAPLSDPVALAMPAISADQETPVMRIDPRPLSAGRGSIIFSSEVAGGGDAVFRISAGKLSRVLSTGARLNDGRVVRRIIFGTVQSAAAGQIALCAFLAPGGQAELLVSPDGAIKVIAAEGAAAPDGAHYRPSFGPPATISAGSDAMVAFAAHTDRGDGVFLYNGQSTRRMLSTGERCRHGTVSYVSAQRPALNSDGSIAVLAGCSGTPAIFVIDGAGARAIVRAQQPGAYPGQFSQLGEPQISRGTVVFGAIGSDDVDRLFAVSRSGQMRRLAPRQLERFDRPALDAATEISHTVSAATLSINQQGTAAYLGGR